MDERYAFLVLYPDKTPSEFYDILLSDLTMPYGLQSVCTDTFFRECSKLSQKLFLILCHGFFPDKSIFVRVRLYLRPVYENVMP